MRKFAVDILKLEHFIIRHRCLREQNVHVAWHTPRNWVDSVFYAHTLFFQDIRHFAQGMLRLRNRHTVTGNDDDAFRLLHHIRSIFSRATLPWALFLGLAAGNSRLRTKAASNNANETAVHGFAHDI